MENAVEALKIAVSVMIFAMALTIGVSSFSNANSAIDTIINLRDRETEYTYVEPSKDSIRTVGIETVVSTMYRAIEQNLEIYFFDKNGNAYPIYYAVDSNNHKIQDAGGYDKEISSINFSKTENGKYTDKEDAKIFLDVLLGGENVKEPTVSNEKKEYYKKRLIYNQGLYNELKGKQFEEKLGEYYEGSGATEIKKRVITYKIIN